MLIIQQGHVQVAGVQRGAGIAHLSTGRSGIGSCLVHLWRGRTAACIAGMCAGWQLHWGLAALPLPPPLPLNLLLPPLLLPLPPLLLCRCCRRCLAVSSPACVLVLSWAVEQWSGTLQADGQPGLACSSCEGRAGLQWT